MAPSIRRNGALRGGPHPAGVGSADTTRTGRRLLGEAPLCLGAGRALERVVKTHLFAIAPNQSGSTFLAAALATCRATWNLPHEGQNVLGYAGPKLGRGELSRAWKIWASRRRWRALLADPTRYDWPRIRRGWYFQAWGRDPQASVFVARSPPYLLLVDELARHFPNPRFLFMVRNPYAVCEGICRTVAQYRLSAAGVNMPEAAARHVVACLEQQRRNVAAHRGRGIFFTYETMCAEPERVARRIAALVPELDDVELRQRLPVKGRYDEMLTDMNLRQIARLDPRRIGALNRVFRHHRGLLDHFGYELLDGDR